MPAPFRLTPVTLGLCAFFSAGFTCAATTVLPETSISADAEADNPRVKETSTATRTATPVRYVPQAIDSIKTANVVDYGTNDLGTALSGIPNVRRRHPLRQPAHPRFRRQQRLLPRRHP